MPAPSSSTSRARLAARRAKAAQDVKVMNLLTAGVSVAEIALREGVPLRRMRERIQAMVARRAMETPAGFVQLQVARLSDALMVAHAAMMEGNLQGLDRVLRIVRELERYHGYRPPDPASEPPRLAAPEAPRALPAPHASETTEISVASD